jgi:hypothetical protein
MKNPSANPGLPLLLALALAAGLPSAALAVEAAPSPDAAAMLWLHLDGDAKDASGHDTSGIPKGNVKWDEGKIGRALFLAGTNGVSFENSRALHLGERSWTVEAWMKPDRDQPAHAVIFASGWGHNREYGLRISYGKQLVLYFSSGEQSGVAVSGDVSATIFDGNWHHVAAVIDRARHGEVRLYLDGKKVGPERPVSCSPIQFENEMMAGVIGNTLPWAIGAGGYRGGLDELRVSAEVRPEYASTEPLPSDLVPKPLVRKKFVFDPADSKKPLPLLPETTIIVTPSLEGETPLFEAAATLSESLRKACGASQGFDVVREAEVGRIEGKAVLALGRTQWAGEEENKDLWQDGFVIRRKANVIVILGGKSRGTFNGAMAFLDRYCGVRFYMPGDLWTSFPKDRAVTIPGEINLREEPYVRATSMTGGGSTPGQPVWIRRNNGYSRTGLAGTHQHNMWGAFPPEKYAEKYPEIYPLIKGKRIIPSNPKDQNWNPCFSEPRLLDAAEESAREYYRQNPNHLWYSFGCQDSHASCECPRCQEAARPFLEKDPKEGAVRAQSELYWKFMNALAERLEKTLPGKRIEGLAYAATRFPPSFKLHPGIVVFTNLHIAEMESDGFLKPGEQGETPLDRWLNLTSAYGNHDWYQGNGYFLPRIYSRYWSKFLRHLKSKVPVVYQHAEMYWNWGLDGPKAWILTRMWWNPDVDPEALLRQLCADMFGPAQEPMVRYFTVWEDLWRLMDNVDGPERKLFKWSNQFATTPQHREMLKECRASIDRATALAQTEEQKKRVGVFATTFRVAEQLCEWAAATKVSKAQLEEFRAFVREKIMPDPTLFKESGDDGIVKQMEEAIKGAIAGKPIE